MTPSPEVIAFVNVCERAAVEYVGCLCCTAQFPTMTYVRLGPERRGYKFEAIVQARGNPCGVLVCRGCGRLLVVGLGSGCAADPADDVLRDIVNGPLGDHLAGLQRAIRLDADPPRHIKITLLPERH